MIEMRSVDELISEHARTDTNLSWSSMMTPELAEEILERSITLKEWHDIVDALDDGVYDILMSFKI